VHLQKISVPVSVWRRYVLILGYPRPVSIHFFWFTPSAIPSFITNLQALEFNSLLSPSSCFVTALQNHLLKRAHHHVTHSEPVSVLPPPPPPRSLSSLLSRESTRTHTSTHINKHTHTKNTYAHAKTCSFPTFQASEVVIVSWPTHVWHMHVWHMIHIHSKETYVGIPVSQPRYNRHASERWDWMSCRFFPFFLWFWKPNSITLRPNANQHYLYISCFFNIVSVLSKCNGFWQGVRIQ